MSDDFGCPECGAVVRPRGRGPGRQVRCRACGTLVEVPYLPRVATKRRKKKRKLSYSQVAWFSGGALLVVLAISLLLGAFSRVMKSRARDRDESVITAISGEGEDAARAGDLDRALGEYQKAAEIAARTRSERAGELSTRRDELAIQLARKELATVPEGDAFSGLERCRALMERAGGDEALRSLVPEIGEAARVAARRAGEDGLAAARLAIRSGDASAALRSTTAVLGALDELSAPEAEIIRASATGLATSLAQEAGVIIEGAQGQFRVGTAGAYDERLREEIESALHRKGYLTEQDAGPWRDLWRKVARFRFVLKVEEQTTSYMASALKASRIEADALLVREGNAIWRSHVRGQTRTPPPSMKALEASRVAALSRPDPEAEAKLHKDALEVLAARLRSAIGGIPDAPRPTGG